jgi:hypothetical protein
LPGKEADNADRRARFRWAACQIEALCVCYDQQKLRDALGDLPETLDKTYDRILATLPRGNLKEATTILRLLAWSERPLRLEEMVDAIAVRLDKSPSFDASNRMPEPRDLLRICSSLVVLVRRPLHEDDDYESDNTTDDQAGKNEVAELRLAHYSVKEYLVSRLVAQPLEKQSSDKANSAYHRTIQQFKGQLAETTATASIAQTCLAYLSDLDHSLSPIELQKGYPFSRYCARYWMGYARLAHGTSEELQIQILAFFDDRMMSTRFTCYSLFNPDRPRDRRITQTQEIIRAPLYCACLGGLTKVVETLLDQGADINAQGGDYGNALQAASSRGYDAIVQMLLDKGADANAKGGLYGNALQAASHEGYDKRFRTSQGVYLYGGDHRGQKTGLGYADRFRARDVLLSC